ncbi:hypothetical protein ACFE04_013169 [Oxalis oulophora]
MASTKVLSRLSSRLNPIALKLNNKKSSSLSADHLLHSPLQKSSSRVSRVSRLPVELSSLQPLHSALASARLVSSLSSAAQSWCLVVQGRYLNAFMKAPPR